MTYALFFYLSLNYFRCGGPGGPGGPRGIIEGMIESIITSHDGNLNLNLQTETIARNLIIALFVYS